MKHLGCPMYPCGLEVATKAGIVRAMYPEIRIVLVEQKRIIELLPSFTKEAIVAASEKGMGRTLYSTLLPPLTLPSRPLSTWEQS